MIISRNAKDTLQRLCTQFPVVGITGPRQSGKTTLATSVFPDKKYITFDDRSMRDLAASNAVDFLMAFPNGAILDEAQKVPEIFDVMIDMINATAEDKAIVETCGHAVYVGRKA